MYATTAKESAGLRRGRPLVPQSRRQGLAQAQHNLGLIYSHGQGVPQDYVQAHKWLNLAASHASGDDQKKYADHRDSLAGKMTAQQIAEAQRLARDWKPKPEGQR